MLWHLTPPAATWRLPDPTFFLPYLCLDFLPSYILPWCRPKQFYSSANKSSMHSQCTKGHSISLPHRLMSLNSWSQLVILSGKVTEPLGGRDLGRPWRFTVWPDFLCASCFLTVDEVWPSGPALSFHNDGLYCFKPKAQANTSSLKFLVSCQVFGPNKKIEDPLLSKVF